MAIPELGPSIIYPSSGATKSDVLKDPRSSKVHLRSPQRLSSYEAFDVVVCPGNAHCIACRSPSTWEGELIEPRHGKASHHYEALPPHIAGFLDKILSASKTSPDGTLMAFKLILGPRDGFIVQRGLLESRMIDCVGVETVFEFCQHDHSSPARQGATGRNDFFSIVLASLAAVVLANSTSGNVDEVLQRLDMDMKRRLSFDWLQSSKVQRSFMVLVGGRPNHRIFEPYMNAARSLNIELIVVDKPGHWLQDISTSAMRAAFLPCDMAQDGKLHERVTAAVKDSGLRVHGIYSGWEGYLVDTAKAAEELGLPTDPSPAFGISTDKARTRAMHQGGTLSSVVTAAASDDELLGVASSIGFPVIMKPVIGCNSEGVTRVDTPQGLRRAFAAASRPYRIAQAEESIDILIESYIDGPEIDANFVLLNGEILFFEIQDDLPKDGDGIDGIPTTGFVEQGMVMPSRLPPAEVSIVKDTLHRVLLDTGFRSGVFHVEARIKDSHFAYKNTTEGLVDLLCREDSPLGSPTCVLLEINARPPGVYSALACKRVYGVDYIAMALLSALGDSERMMRLCKPYQYDLEYGAQYWCQLLLLPVRQGGRCLRDPHERLLAHAPECMRSVKEFRSFFREGDQVVDPSTGVYDFSAYAVVVSKRSRHHVMKLAQSIRSNYILEVES